MSLGEALRLPLRSGPHESRIPSVRALNELLEGDGIVEPRFARGEDKGTRPARARSTIGRSDSRLARNSVKYLALNCAHLSGSWLNQRRKTVDGATSFGQRSIFASCFETPRGHSRSTRIRKPSDRDGVS